MKKSLFVLFILLFLIACSSETNNDNQSETSNKPDNNETNEQAKEATLEEEVLFTYDHEDNGDYYIRSIRSDSNGESIAFLANGDDDRKKEDYAYLLTPDGTTIEGTDLADGDDEEAWCTSLKLSPDGSYLTYNCMDDDSEFSIYDVDKKETIYQMPRFELSVKSVKGISDDKKVYLETKNDDRQIQLTIFDGDDESTENYVMGDLLDGEQEDYNDDFFDRIIPTDDGKQMLISTFTNLYLFDVEDDTITELADTTSYADEYDAEIFVYDIKFSPDGTYAHYKISENKKDPVFSEHFFHDFENDEVTSYEEFDYEKVRDIDEEGNILLEGEDNLYLYNVGSKETRIIPDVEKGIYGRAFTLTSNGEFLIYTDKESHDDDTHTQTLIRTALGDTSAYETTELRAQEKKEVDDPGQDEITLTEQSFDEEDLLNDIWESGTNVMFPAEFPDEVKNHAYIFSGKGDEERYSETTYFKTDESPDDKISMTVTEKSDTGCVGVDDLELVDTAGGDDYYFHDYKNEDVEALVERDGQCYFFEAEDRTEEDMMTVAQSLEPVDEVPHDIALDDVKFPTKFPIDNPNAVGPKISSSQSGKKISYMISYNGDKDKDTDIYMKYEIQDKEPNLYTHSDNESMDIDGFEDVFYNEEHGQIFLNDGNHYYEIELSIDNDMLTSYGADHVRDVFHDIAASVE